MKVKLISLLLVVPIVGVFVLLIPMMPADVHAVSSTNDASAWIDAFDHDSIGPRWAWVRENPAYWSLTAKPGSLRLVTQGSLNAGSNNLENILLTPLNLDYRVITKVFFSPTENFQRAGLVVYQDDDNYLQLTRVYSNGDHVRIKTEIGGVPTYIYAPDPVAVNPVYLRIDRYGMDYYGFYSLDGDVWEFVGQEHLNFAGARVGLLAANGPTTAEIPADFEYFQFVPRAYNSSWQEDFNGPALDSSWSWVNEDPTHWSLSTNPGFLQIITQSGGLFDAGSYHNLLIKEAPQRGFRMTTKASISPTENFQGVSIVVYGDDQNYLRLGLRFANTGNQISFRHEQDDVVELHIQVPENATSAYLRVVREGEVYSGYYSVDGDRYIYVGQTAAAIVNPKIGILSENGPSNLEINTDYDFFLLETNLERIYLPFLNK